jgi:dTDP-4-amino-4,6-dideoxygalactose transaminase
MTNWKVPLADVVVTDDDIAAVVATYRSGWLSMGQRTADFEAAFSEYVGTRHAIAVSSGTAALHLMCLAAGLAPGDEVLVPSLTFVATVNAVRYVGATPVFVDIAGPLEPWMCAERCEQLLTPRTRAILHVDYGGHAGELTRLVDLAARHGLELLQDAAHAVGTRVAGCHAGSLGLASAFSFFSNKNLAIGEGGMVVTDNDAFAERVRLLRSHGMTTLTWDRHRGHASGYDVVALGFNYRIDEPRAALGRVRLQRVDEENARRAALDGRYREALAGVVPCALPAAPGVSSAHHLFTIVLPDHVNRHLFRARLVEDGVQTSVHYPAVHRFSVHAHGAPDLPLTDRYAERTVTLPMFAHMSHAQQDAVIASVAGALDC